MDTIDAVYKRRAVKQFDNTHSLTEAEERKLLEATIQAPTSFNIQHWRFVILRDPELRARIRREFGNDQAQMTVNLPEDHVMGPMVAIGKGLKDPWPKPGQLPLEELVFENAF